MALEQITFNLGALEDSANSGKNYVAGQVFEVFNIDDTYADIFADSAGTIPIDQSGIQNISNSDGECKFFINKGFYNIKSGGKSRQLNANFSFEFETVSDAINARFISLLEDRRVFIVERNAYFNVVLSSSFTGGNASGKDELTSAVDNSYGLMIDYKSSTSADNYGAKSGDPSFNNAPFMNRVYELNSQGYYIRWPQKLYYFSSTFMLFRSNTAFGGFNSIMKGWGLSNAATTFIYNGSAANSAMICRGIEGSTVDPTYPNGDGGTGINIVENLTLENFALFPETDYQCDHGMEFDASAFDSKTGYIRNITINDVSIEKCGSHNVVIRCDVFDFKAYNLTSRISGGACFKTAQGTPLAGLREEPDQIFLFAPILFSQLQGATVTNNNAWALDANGTSLHGGNIQGSLGAKLRFGCGIYGTHIEHQDVGADGSIGIAVEGSWNSLYPKWIVGYQTGLQVGTINNNMEGIVGSIPFIDGKQPSGGTGVLITSGGARNSELSVGEIKGVANDILDNQGNGEVVIHHRSKRLSTYRTFIDGDTTPPVNRGSIFKTSNTNPTTITDFTGGRNGEIITVLFNDNNTTIQVVGNPNFDSDEKLDIVVSALASYSFLRDSANNKWIIIGR